MVTYTKKYPVLIEIKVLGRKNKRVWRTSDRANKICRALGLILESQHSVGNYLSQPLQLSNLWVCWRTGSVQLRGVKFISNGFSINCVRHDYKGMSKIISEMILLNNAQGAAKLASDFRRYQELLEKPTLGLNELFLVVNNCALLPMANR